MHDYTITFFSTLHEQADGLVDLVTTAGPDADQAKDLDLRYFLSAEPPEA
jgi:hypothetical protein